MSYQLDDNKIFLTIVDCGSFTAAADKLDIPQPTISRRIKQLEQHLGLRLFERQGRSVQLSDFGQQFVAHCRRIEQAVFEAESFAEHSKNEPAGKLVIEAPYLAIKLILAKFTGDFSIKYPQISLEFVSITADRWQDPLINDLRFLAIPSNDQSLICRPCMPYKFSFFAAPSLLAKYGTPNHPRDLENYPCICLSGRLKNFIDWHYVENGQVHPLNVHGPVTVDHMTHAKAPAVQGQGVLLTSADFIHEEIAQGILIPLFNGQYSFHRHGYLYYKSRRYQPLREKVFVEEFLATFANHSFKI